MAVSLQKLKKRIPETGEKRLKKIGRFDGLSEDEVKKNTLKDILESNLDLIFIGINPSLMAAYTGRYYAGPGNHFYKLLYESELIPESITYECDDALLQYKIGLTNIVARATRSSADLSRAEIKKGAVIIHEKLKKFKPKIAIFNGKCIYEEFTDKYDKKNFCFGLQPWKIGDTALWVVPSSSARCANFPRIQDKLHFYSSLKKYLAFLKGQIKEVNLQDFVFEGRCKQTIPSTSKMWRRKNLSVFAHGGKVVNKETVCMDTSEENILAVPKSSEFIFKKCKKIDTNSEKDSKVLAGTSDFFSKSSQEQKINRDAENRNESHKSSNSIPKCKLSNRHERDNNIFNKSSINIKHKERAETIDFVSLIKQRLNHKEMSVNENKKDIELLPKSKVNTTKGLKYTNLQLCKSKQSFKIKTIYKGESDE